MEFVLLGRGKGKTEFLLRWLEEAPEGENRVLVSHTKEESRRVQRIGIGLGLESWQFVSLPEVTRHAWSGVLVDRGGLIVLGLDNLDLMLSTLLGWEVGIATVST